MFPAQRPLPHTSVDAGSEWLVNTSTAVLHSGRAALKLKQSIDVKSGPKSLIQGGLNRQKHMDLVLADTAWDSLIGNSARLFLILFSNHYSLRSHWCYCLPADDETEEILLLKVVTLQTSRNELELYLMWGKPDCHMVVDTVIVIIKIN